MERHGVGTWKGIDDTGDRGVGGKVTIRGGGTGEKAE